MTKNGQMDASRRQIDDAAFGVVYGSIAVMAQLMGMHPPIDDPARRAVILFGSVLAIALAKAVAEVSERLIETGQPASAADIRRAWSHSQTVLIAANGPTLAFVLAAIGVIDPDWAYYAAQVLAIGLLAWFGGRIGWRVGGTLWSAALSALVTGALATLVSVLKAILH